MAYGKMNKMKMGKGGMKGGTALKKALIKKGYKKGGKTPMYKDGGYVQYD